MQVNLKEMRESEKLKAYDSQQCGPSPFSAHVFDVEIRIRDENDGENKDQG